MRRRLFVICIVSVMASILLWASRGHAPSGAGSGRISVEQNALGRCITLLNADEKSRNANVALGARTLDGIIVEPGDEFSFNESTGKRGAEEGFMPARIIVDGKNESGLAGGICQLSSTLYNAALLSGMEITERHPHSRPVPYLPAGLDATVSYGARDLKWINTNHHSVTVRARVEGDRLEVWLEGEGSAPDIRLIPEIVESMAPRPMAPPDATGRSVAPPRQGASDEIRRGVTGYRVRVWTETTSPGGGRVRELVSDDLYEPVHAIVD
ncbi:MAG: VanW family protein [Firmicutes bacterium]|jgi:vancomycin resistance protein YoaR|nr:VanW family protein [Bacillota bacterium]MDD4336175.1 VanW family protein [Bacillota bacterium]